MAYLPGDLKSSVTLAGFFVVEEKDWAGEQLYAIDGHNDDDPVYTKDLERLFPSQWVAVVHQVEIRPQGDYHEVVCQQISGPTVTIRVEPGALSEVVTITDEGLLELGWEPHDGDQNEPIFWHLIGGDTSLKLRRLEARDREKVLGFELPADRYLLERVLSSVVDGQATRTINLPVSHAEMRIDARTAQLAPGERHRCVSIELWFAVGASEDPLAEMVLIARSTENGWSYGYSKHWLDACVELAIPQPYQLPGMSSVLLDPNRASLLIRLFVRGRIYRDTVMLFADPPGRLTSASDLPLEMQHALASALEYQRKRVGKPDSPESLRQLRVLEGLLEGGLAARLDSLIDAVDYPLAQSDLSAVYLAERDSKGLEESLVAGLGHIFLARAEVQVIRRAAEDSWYGDLLLRFAFDHGLCSVEVGFSNPPEGQQSSGDEIGFWEMEEYRDFLDDALKSDVLKKLGFDTDDTVFTKAFNTPLFEPDVVGRQVVTFLQAFGLLSSCEVFVGVPAIDPSMPASKVWGSQ